MHTDRDVTRIVRAWLRTDEHESADRVLHDVLALLNGNSQRRPWWPAGRFVAMNTFAKGAISTAAVVVVAVIGINLLPSNGGAGANGPVVSPSATPRPSPSSTPASVAAVEPLGIGLHALTMEGIPLSFSLTTSNPAADGWARFGDLYIAKSIAEGQTAEAMIYWTTFPDGIDAHPCAQLLSPPVGRSAADLAAAVSRAAGTDLVAGPVEVTVGGRVAQHVVLTVGEDLGCDPGYFYTWQQKEGGPFWAATEVGDTINVWIVDIDGTLVFIAGETNLRASPDLEQEVQQIVESIRFSPGDAVPPLGRYAMTVEGVPFSFSVPTPGWGTHGPLYISKSTAGSPAAEAVIYWTGFPDGVYADPCDVLLSPTVGPTAADSPDLRAYRARSLAAAISTAPGTDLVTGPSDVTVGERTAKHVVLTVREDLGCDPGFFYTWAEDRAGNWWGRTDVGDTIRVWIVEATGAGFPFDRKRLFLFIAAETHPYAGPENGGLSPAQLDQEIQQIVESISFQ